MGTPDFAVPCLEVLVRDGHQVLAVVTQPDRPKGRGQRLAHSPVKQAAQLHDLPVLQPRFVKDKGFIEELRHLDPELIIVVAYGQVLPKDVLQLPVYGCINVHASLLPQYRGAAPIHWAVINGETKTGITTMVMDEGLDTGDMLLKAELPIRDTETVGSVHDRLSLLGSSLLSETVKCLSKGTLKCVSQDYNQASYAPMLSRADELINWADGSAQVLNRIRGMNPWPVAFTVWQGKTLKIWQGCAGGSDDTALPGTVVGIDKNLGFKVQTGKGQVYITEVQPQGGKRMAAADFVRGYFLSEGDKLGD